MATLVEKLLRGSFFRILNIVVIVVVSFFMMPFVIHALGERWYGLWIFAASIVGYYGFLDFGLLIAIQKFISQASGKDDDEDINRIFNTSLFLFFMGSLLIVLVSLVIIWLCPRFVHDPGNINIFRKVILLIGLDVAFSFSVRAFIGFLGSNIRHDVIEGIDIIKLLVRTALIVIFLKRGYGIVSLAVITVGVNSIQYLSVVIYVLVRYKILKIRRSYISRIWMKKLLGFGTFSFIVMVSKRIRFHTDNFVISAFLGLGAVTHYNIGSRVAIYYQSIVQTGIALMFPVFSKLEGQNDFESIREKYILMIKLTSIFSVFSGGFLVIFGKAFISRWMGIDFIDAYAILVILVIGMLFDSVQSVSATVLLAVSKHKQYSIIVSSEAIANLVLSLILVRKYGIIGVAWGTTIPLLITSLFITPVYTCRVIKVPLLNLLKVLSTSILFGAGIYFISWLVIRNMIEISYLSILKLGVPVCSLALLLNIFVLLNSKERRYFKIAG
ncbi:MAG: polysaccharide biosynthesis C-terminal domain-containing protein [Candidatus Krumholzibacteriota bacterium]|nr:polysaccharide biosynthesis C-terminal domain-containing protein [Candidatus Krumholzibacteriota bacterium]